MADLWSDVTEQPILAIESGTWANVIADSTCCLQQCIQQLLTHLDNRARALATSGNFEAALKDVARIRQLAPSSAVGYLCAGHVYSLQGRQKAAIDIYDQGLVAVSSSDPSHQQLVKARSMAQERDNTRIDFINKFPLDIITNVAPRILSEEKMTPSVIREYLGVSRVWREKLLMCIRQLHVFSTIDDNHVNDKNLLGLIAPYCTALTLKSKVVSLRQFISDARFPLLRALNIVDSYYHSYEDDEEDYGSRDVLDTIISFRSKATLTHLTISVDELCDIPLGDILSSCPYLVDLETTYINTNMSTAPASCPNMKSLSFMLNEDQDFDMDDITKRFPGLEKLAVSPFYYATDLKIIQDNCPKLRVIGSHENGDFPATSNPNDMLTAGVRTFYVHDYEAHWLDEDQGDMEHVMEFIKQNSHTLQDITFYTSLPFSGPSDQVGAVDVSNIPQFNRMTSYTQQIYIPQHLRIARMVAQKSPHLKKFELISAFDDDTDAGVFFEDLIGHCKLEVAIVRLACFDPLLDMERIERFIQYHGTIDSQLHTLILPDYGFISTGALDTLIALPRLKTLGFGLPLVFDEDDTSENGLDDADGEHAARFIQKLGLGCPQLEHLEITSGSRPIQHIIFVQLSKLKIKSLKFAIPVNSNTLASLLTLLECPQLQELHIYPACNTKDPMSNYVRKMLKSKIPSVTW
ncbi:predicted protein [Lichtheimia corymbifera JMRC:FSU:9682]|uniref:Uncharacterized protein n=1 Tax=Lichtheimia corymbifera JMRC:FSU:9682 TaxID=1263082 RepID=A0A068RX53_9FUNG|nr:predicted protein [Lichtheimia corymbifera JMRC:FSU:9682]